MDAPSIAALEGSPVLVGAGRLALPRRRRQLLWLMLILSALLHLAVLAWLLTVRRAPAPAASSPLEVELMPEPAAPVGRQVAPQEAGPRPEQLPPSVPSAAAAPPPAAPQPSPTPEPVPTPKPTPVPVPVPQPAPAPVPRPGPVPQPAPTAPSAAVRLQPPPPDSAAEALIAPSLPAPRLVPPPPLPPPPPSPRRQLAAAAPMAFRWGDNPFNTPSAGNSGRRGSIDLGLPAGIRDSHGKPPPPLGNLDSMARVVGAQVGPGWLQLLHEWWDRHGYYPEEAAAMGQDGTVQLHLSVDRDGRVLSVHLDSSAGSPFLDLGAQAIFRGAKLPPFPPNTPENRADVYLTIEYILLRR